MANEIIKPHRFEDAKNKIQTLAHNVPSTVSLNKFPTEGTIFPWNNHNITGSEANKLLVSPLQSALIAQNNNIRSLFNIADEVYKALESLDKEYIAGIITSIESAKVASGQAKTASTKAEQASMQAFEASQKALEASKKANNAQDDIKKTIEGLTMTVQILKDFKEKVTKDLGNVSSLNTQTVSIRNRVQNIEHKEGQIKGKLKSLENQIKYIYIKINSISESAEILQSIQPYLSSLSNFKDVNAIWNDVKSQKKYLIGFHQHVDDFIEKVNHTTEHIHSDIVALQQYRSMLESFQHLSDVDVIWNDVENHKTNLAGFHLQVDDFIEKVNHTTEHIHSDIVALQQYRSMLESFQHLSDVDAIWNDVENHKTDLAGFHQQMDVFIERINQTTEHIHSDIVALQQYRSMLESFQHLSDVDVIWNDVENHKTNLAGFHLQVDNFIEKVNHTTEHIHSDIVALQQYRSMLESFQHLSDVDVIWNDVENHKTNLAGFHLQVDDFIEKVNHTTEHIHSDIVALQQYRSMLESFQHLSDVDVIWNDVENHKTNLAGFHLQVDDFIEKVNHTTEHIHSDIVALQQYRSMLESFQHLSDVDVIWNDVENHKTNLAGFHLQVDDFIEKVNHTTEHIHSDIVALQQYRSMLESFQHLSDVDAIWNDVENHKTDLAGFHQQMDVFIERINQTTEHIHSDIVALQQYRSMLESFQHLSDVDVIWNDVENHKTNLAGFHLQVDDFIEKVNHTTEHIHSDIVALQQYRSMLESFQHLSDVDAIWNDVENHKTDLAGFHQQMDVFIERINQTTEHIHSDIVALQQYRSMLESFQHLSDVDVIWNDVENHKTNLAGFHLQVDNFIEKVNHTTEHIHSDIVALQQYRSMLESFQHLSDVDVIWNDVENHKTNLAGFHLQVDNFIEKVNHTTEHIHSDIVALQQYRSMLESFQHLSDVDVIWNDVENHKTNLAGFHLQVDNFIEKVNHTTEHIHSDIVALQQYRSMLESFQHLSDVDVIWNDVENHKTNLVGFHLQVDNFIEKVNHTTEHIHSDIVALQQYRSMLESFQHLSDVDVIWNDVENHKTDLAGFHQQVDDFISEVHTVHAEIKDSIKNLENANTTSHIIYEKRIRIAYYVGGIALSLSIINYILQILGVF